MFKVIIPARMKSKRLQQKMVQNICGMTLIEHVVRRAVHYWGNKNVAVATDSPEIELIVRPKFDNMVPVVLTYPWDQTFDNGTERVYHAAKVLGMKGDDVVVNLQGDNFIFDKSVIDQAIQFAKYSHLISTGYFKLSTDAFSITSASKKDLYDEDVVKVILKSGISKDFFGDNKYACLFTRSISRLHIGYICKHLGFYAMKVNVAKKYSSLSQTYLEKTEGLEQWRAIENGIPIFCIESHKDFFEINNQYDLEKARKLVDKGINKIDFGGIS